MLRLKNLNIAIREQKPLVSSSLGKVEDYSYRVSERPSVVNAKVYKIKSFFVKHAVYLTLSYITENGKNRPFEIFINSKDLSRAADFAALTRLISAIFRRTDDPSFLLEELNSIYDPNGGYFKDGVYMHSFYSEIAAVLKQFFSEIGIIRKESTKQTILNVDIHDIHSDKNMISGKEHNDNKENTATEERGAGEGEKVASPEGEAELMICPECNQKTLKIENGCMTCINPECGYSKCDH